MVDILLGEGKKFLVGCLSSGTTTTVLLNDPGQPTPLWSDNYDCSATVAEMKTKPSYTANISNCVWRTYVYGDGRLLNIEIEDEYINDVPSFFGGQFTIKTSANKVNPYAFSFIKKWKLENTMCKNPNQKILGAGINGGGQALENFC